ncbi:glucosamine-6-phosphate deaminase [Adhaeribacter radiodurans]|uniref:Glucosamine-6-phosphate deaminase n=1 Tax=Adhaeribacter radiodurans TaxID=2745197 RepID=A0A7L7L3P3_9BACT|nr:glucosamine-6-phosphate deaminase [Adhaeribacter radiodurans]QMU27393.1 glucosamine-6-phosphate deaminase [Adhaeribacter radiodurans]
MEIKVLENPIELGKSAGKAAAELIRKTIADKGYANVILATGTSQFETLNQLIAEKDINWSKVTMFHLDEYIGLPITAKASFRKYLKERFLDKVPELKAAYLVDGENDPEAECERLGNAIHSHPIEVALVGVGENGHLAFNDPPADFDTEQPYIIVELDEQCRRQQFNEGWFDTLEDVPNKAISMSVRQIMKSKHIICSVPDSRKAAAVRNCLEEAVDNQYPASILQQHPNCSYYLDEASASLLSANVQENLKT